MTPAPIAGNAPPRALSETAAKALSARRASLPALEQAARARLSARLRYEPDLRDIVERVNALRDEVGDLLHERHFDGLVPRAEDVRFGHGQRSAARTFASIQASINALAAYIDALLAQPKPSSDTQRRLRVALA